MAEQFKESAELLAGVQEIAVTIIEALGDGFQVTDIPTVVAKLSTNPKVVVAIEGVSKVKSEFAEMTPEKIADSVKELSGPAANLVIGIILALRANAAKKAQ